MTVRIRGLDGGAVLRVVFGPLPAEGLAVRLEKIRWTDASFQVLAFLNLPAERLASAGFDDPCFADLFAMYGAGDRRSRGEVYLTGSIQLRPELIARVGQPESNELLLVPRDLDGSPLAEPLLELAQILTEPLPSPRRADP